MRCIENAGLCDRTFDMERSIARYYFFMGDGRSEAVPDGRLRVQASAALAAELLPLRVLVPATFALHAGQI